MRINLSSVCFMVVLFLINFVHAQNDSIYWPKINKESKTWTRGRGMGSAVNKKDIIQSLITFETAGVGGVEIEPI